MVDMRRLQKLINATVKHGARYHTAQRELSEYTADQYGYEACDVDSDWIIDQIFGGCGAPQHMTAQEYHSTLLRDGEKVGLTAIGGRKNA